MFAGTVIRDERTIAIENASYRWAYLFLAFGLLASTMYRSFVRNESSWDLIALVILSGALTAIFQGSRKVLTKRSAMIAALAAVAAAVIGLLLTIFATSFRAASGG